MSDRPDASVYDWQAPCGGSPEAAAEAYAAAEGARIYAMTHRTEAAIPTDHTALVHDYHAGWHRANTTRDAGDISHALALGEALDACPENVHGEAGYENSRIA